jgi:hypothetical protein
MSAALSDQMARSISTFIRLDEIEQLAATITDKPLRENIMLRIDEGKQFLRDAIAAQKLAEAE